MSFRLNAFKKFCVDLGELAKDIQDKNNRDDAMWIVSPDAVKPGLMFYVRKRLPASSPQKWRIGKNIYNVNETCLVVNVETTETESRFEREILVLVGTQYETIYQGQMLGPVQQDKLNNLGKVLNYIFGEKRVDEIERWSMLTVLNADLLDFLTLRKEKI